MAADDRPRSVPRRWWVLGTAAAAILVAGLVTLSTAGPDQTVRPADPIYAENPLRPRAAHTATLLQDGRVLIVGGCATDGCTTAEGAPDTEFYVPGLGFTAGPALATPRQGHSAALLMDGRVLVVGGWPREGSSPLDSAEVYDPATGRFELVGPLTTPRGANTATVLADGRVLVVGGSEDSTATEIFDPASNTFTPAAPLPPGGGGGSVIALPDGRVLAPGGRDDAGKSRPAAIYDPAADAWQLTGAMAAPRTKAALAPLPDGRVLVLGGTLDDHDIQLLRSTEIYDPATGRFEPGPPMDVARYKFVAVSTVDDRIVVAGGTQMAVYEGGAFRPIPGTTGPIHWLPSLTALPDGGVLVVGGYDDRIRLHADAQVIGADQIAASANGPG